MQSVRKATATMTTAAGEAKTHNTNPRSTFETNKHLGVQQSDGREVKIECFLELESLKLQV